MFVLLHVCKSRLCSSRFSVGTVDGKFLYVFVRSYTFGVRSLLSTLLDSKLQVKLFNSRSKRDRACVSAFTLAVDESAKLTLGTNEGALPFSARLLKLSRLIRFLFPSLGCLISSVASLVSSRIYGAFDPCIGSSVLRTDGTVGSASKQINEASCMWEFLTNVGELVASHDCCGTFAWEVL